MEMVLGDGGRDGKAQIPDWQKMHEKMREADKATLDSIKAIEGHLLDKMMQAHAPGTGKQTQAAEGGLAVATEVEVGETGATGTEVGVGETAAAAGGGANEDGDNTAKGGGEGGAGG